MPDHEALMRLAIAESRKARAAGNHPFACVDDEGSIDCVCGVGNP